MSEGTDTNASQDGKQTTDATSADGFRPITSQEDFEARLKDRLTRERAKFADYDDLKAKASKVDELEAAAQAKVEEAVAALTAAQAEADQAKTEAMRFRIAVQHGITTVDDIELFLTGTDEETLTNQAKRLAARDSDRKTNGAVVRGEGQHAAGSVATTADLFAEAVGQALP